ncbi:MAG: HAD hydrolase-like protein [Lachnospiraceae bacterium]|nr:HAD hydrolase-like protein [Lachnospiraceae bacterium]
MSHYKAVIFDLDGTLLDTSEGIFSSVTYAINTLGLADIPQDVLRTFIGPPIQKSFARVYGMDKEEADRAADVFRNRYKDHDLMLARPYDGMFETLERLSEAGVKTAVATYKRQDYAEKILTGFGFDRAVDAICGSDFAGKLTKKDIIVNAIERLGITDRSQVVMTGDSDNDAIGASEIGVSFVGVTYGFGFSSAKDVEAFSNIGSADSPEGILRYVL